MVKKITKTRIVSAYLEDYGRKYYLRELALLLKKPHQTIKPYLDQLVKENILIKKAKKGIVEYGLNLKDKKLDDYLVIAEKERLIERLNKDTVLRILFESLSACFENNIFIIFGSAVEKLEKGSDIDLLIAGKKNVSKKLEDFEKVYSKKVHKVQIAGLKDLTPALSKEIYKKHIIFNNTEPVIRFFRGLA